jgi:hypothetical protein
MVEHILKGGDLQLFGKQQGTLWAYALQKFYRCF